MRPGARHIELDSTATLVNGSPHTFGITVKKSTRVCVAHVQNAIAGELRTNTFDDVNEPHTHSRALLTKHTHRRHSCGSTDDDDNTDAHTALTIR